MGAQKRLYTLQKSLSIAFSKTIEAGEGRDGELSIEHCQLRLRSLSEELKQMLLRSRQKLKATVEVFWPK
jgi:hypothetical protein